VTDRISLFAVSLLSPGGLCGNGQSVVLMRWSIRFDDANYGITHFGETSTKPPSVLGSSLRLFSPSALTLTDDHRVSCSSCRTRWICFDYFLLSRLFVCVCLFLIFCVLLLSLFILLVSIKWLAMKTTCKN